MDLSSLMQTSTAILVGLAWKLLGAAVLWIIGRWLITFAIRMLSRTLSEHRSDPTLTRYLLRSLSVVLNIALVIALLGFFGVETTTFAALLAAGGVAIGMAWSGLLANFAAGAFLVFLRPFKAGDAVTAAGITGTVESIGLFGTTINTPDNVLTIIGNNRIFSETIQNYSANPYRRVDLTATISNAVDHHDAIHLLKSRLSGIPNVLATPAPEVDILQFTAAGPLLCVRPYCNNAHYWQVYFDTNRLIREAFGEANYPAPVPVYALSTPLAGPQLGGAPR